MQKYKAQNRTDLVGKAIGISLKETEIVEPEGRDLTQREREVLALVAEGLSNKEIGAELSISEKTVSAHILNLNKKYKARNRTDLVGKAFEISLKQTEIVKPEGKDLTQREREVLALVAEGLSNKEIEAELSISENTGRNSIRTLMRKYNVQNRTHLMLKGFGLSQLQIEDQGDQIASGYLSSPLTDRLISAFDREGTMEPGRLQVKIIFSPRGHRIALLDTFKMTELGSLFYERPREGRIHLVNQQSGEGGPGFSGSPFALCVSVPISQGSEYPYGRGRRFDGFGASGVGGARRSRGAGWGGFGEPRCF